MAESRPTAITIPTATAVFTQATKDINTKSPNINHARSITITTTTAIIMTTTTDAPAYYYNKGDVPQRLSAGTSPKFRQYGGSEVFLAKGEMGVVDHLLDALLLGLGADEKHVAGIGHDIVFKPSATISFSPLTAKILPDEL